MPRRVSSNILHLLVNRERGLWMQSASSSGLQKLAEDKAVSSKMQETHCKLPSSARSTFLMAFSPDSTKVASTHGDHKIYVCDVQTGKLLHKLEGHPRTPWCLAFHPSSNDILASGCLGGEVRVWDLHGGSEKWEADQNTVITSLTFHPLDKVLVIATYNLIHFWDWSLPKPFATCKTSSDREKVRFVKFDHLGARLITGITNLIPETSRGAAESFVTQSSSRSLTYNTFHSHRRSILSRLISMYRQMEGLEEMTRLQESQPRPNSPTQEDALNQAREFAEMTTRSNFTQRLHDSDHALALDENTILNSTTSLWEHESPNIQEFYIPDINESSNNFATRYFWATFQRLRFICASLEQRLPPVRRNAEPRADSQPSSASNDHSQNSSVDLGLNLSRSGEEANLNNNNGNLSNNLPHISQHRVSVSLINLLTRLQSALQNAVLSNAHAQGQIQQLQLRICEILERLTSVTGYRARLNSLRAQIYEAAERAMRRGNETSTIQRWDLAHCLWLVEMSLELTRQMHQILRADIRLTRLHFASPTSDCPYNSYYSAGPSSEDTSGSSSSITAALNLVSSMPRTSQRDSDPMFSSSSVNRTSIPVDQGHSTASVDSDGQSSSAHSQIDCDTSNLTLNRHQSNQGDHFNETHSSDLFRTLYSDVANDSNLRDEASSGSNNLGGWHSDLTSEINDNLSAPSTSGLSSFFLRSSVEPPDNSLIGSNEQTYEDHDHYTLPQRRRRPQPSDPSRRLIHLHINNGGNSSSRPPFYIPDIPDVQIEASPPTSTDSEPLPLHERPRSPPLSTILYGTDPGPSTWGRVPPYFSTVYDGSFPPRLGNQEPLNFTHRIQAWDFSKFQLPVLSDVNSNIVVRKCKIHNDASVDISKDGKTLVALVPSRKPLSNSLILSVHSLQPKTLGQCLYSMPFESNAISVSLSPLGRFIVVGLASPRLYFASHEREAVARILKLEPDGKVSVPKHVRSLTQQVFDGIYHPQVSLNSVRWLPHSGQGLIYGTNRGCLCICKPVSPMNYRRGKISRKPRALSHFDDLTLGLQPRNRNRLSIQPTQQTSASTQTTETETQTTGTQTFNSNVL